MVRVSVSLTAAACLAAVGAAHAGTGGWADFSDETAQRLVVDPSLGASDTQEKDYIWGDVDQDGDIDLIIVRKNPFTSPGGKVNLLLMNEGISEGHGIDGVLVDRTSIYAVDADDGGQGFNDLTNDRDVVLVDVNNDTWLDIVTAPTLSDGLPKTISHPRIYMNKGELAGVWQGFRYEEARIPQFYTMPGPVGGSPAAPRFCSVHFGDVTGNLMPDLYFGDYDSGGSGPDINDRLLINDGSGTFSDSLQTRMSATMLQSAFGTSVHIADMNLDGKMDVVKDTALSSPTRVSVSYNDTGTEGIFGGFDILYSFSPYFISVGDLNDDGRLDIVITDDGTDRYLLNQSNGGDGMANFSQFTFPSGPSSGFGGNSVIADLNKDDFVDVLITDVDVDINNCNSGRMHVYRNLGDLPNVSFQEQGQVIPDGMLTGTHDVAVFDINGDDWLDLVVGRCTGTQVWINQPPQGLLYTYPDGLPSFVQPNTPHDFRVRVSPTAGADPEPTTGELHYSINGGPFVDIVMPEEATDLYLATLPGTECTGQIDFYVTSEKQGGGVFFDPPGAPGVTYRAIAAEGTEISLRDEIEDDVSGWTITNDASLTAGGWEQAEPNGTIFNSQVAAPPNDDTNGLENVKAFVTQNGLPAGDPLTDDIDGGPTTLTTPVFDLDGTDATVSYSRWFFSDGGFGHVPDFMTVEITNDGSVWVPVGALTTGGTGGTWQNVSFLVSDYITTSATMQVRFIASDEPNDSVTEAGIDNFQVDRVVCCASDCADPGNGMVDTGDLLALLAQWGLPNMGCDTDQNGTVDIADLLKILGDWGGCS